MEVGPDPETRAIRAADAHSSIARITDPDDWDAVVLAIGGHPLQSAAWGQLKAGFGWEPVRLAAEGGSAAAQVLIRRRRGLSVAYVPRGPVFSTQPDIDRGLVDEIVGVARSHRSAFLRFEPDVEQDHPAASALDESLRGQGFRAVERTLQPRSSIHLDLGPEPDQLMRAFSKGHRGNVRGAERDGVIVRAGDDGADVDRLHEMLLASGRRKSFGSHSAAYFRRLLRSFGDDARLLLAERESSVVSALLAICRGRLGIYLAGGSNEAGLEYSAAHLLQWHAIRWARERGAQTWDMWGIADARGQLELGAWDENAGAAAEQQRAALEAAAQRDPLDSLYRFKKGWGGQVVRLMPAYDRVFIAPAYWFWLWRRGEA